MTTAELETIAKTLRDARSSATPCPPVRTAIGDGGLEAAYAIQEINLAHWSKTHRRVGHKVGFASRFSQRQAILEEPIYGALFADMAFSDGDEIELDCFCDVKVEVELAIVLAADITETEPIYSDVVRAIAFVLPAIEIVDPRIKGWDITPVDAVADNAGAAGFVLGGCPRGIGALDVSALPSVLRTGDDVVSESGGEMFKAHPITTALWIARRQARLGRGLKAGEVIMAGALGPPVSVKRGERITAEIAQVGSVEFVFV